MTADWDEKMKRTMAGSNASNSRPVLLTHVLAANVEPVRHQERARMRSRATLNLKKE